MSMLSAQADELRELAVQLQEHGTFVGFGGTTNTDPLMHGAAMAMREAADTILSLRDKAQELQAENAKLRKLVRMAWKCAHTGLSCSDCRMVAGGCTLQSAMRELGVD